jgi:hypothetical protein
VTAYALLVRAIREGWAAPAEQPEERREALTAAGIAELRAQGGALAEAARRRPDGPMIRAALRPILKRLAG